MLNEHTIQIRVRYDEADPMGFVHHANYLRYFELGRTELLRAGGGNYRQMEAEGLLIVVVSANVKYLAPARYDDLLDVHTKIADVGHAKIRHQYYITRFQQTPDAAPLVTRPLPGLSSSPSPSVAAPAARADQIVKADVTLAVIDRQGQVQRVPEWLRHSA